MHCKRLTRRACKFSEKKALALAGSELMVRFFKVFPPTVAPVILHALIDHGPEDLRWGYLQGLYNFESFWGKLVHFRTRATDPEANIMSVHRMLQVGLFIVELIHNQIFFCSSLL